MLLLASFVGVFAKKYKFSRPALLFGFILADRVEALTIQMMNLYSFERLVDRPIFWSLVLIISIVFIWGLTRKNKLDYA